MAPDVINALSESEKAKGFKIINRDFWEKWINRKDLFDHVVMKSVEFIVGFINQAGGQATKPTLAALFLNSPDKVDEVLNKIKYNDNDLIQLTSHRPELAESHVNFFKAINKIKNPENQESAVSYGIRDLFYVEKHDSVIPLIDALESSTFSRKVKNAVIQPAFYEGAKRGIKYFEEKFYKRSAITPNEYAKGLFGSWYHDNSKEAFQFLLAQADQGDLEEVKKDDKYKKYQKVREVIDDAFPKAGPAGERLGKGAMIAMKIFSEIGGLEPLGKENAPGGIIKSYLVDESEGIKSEKE